MAAVPESQWRNSDGQLLLGGGPTGKRSRPRPAASSKVDTPVVVEARRLADLGHRVVELDGVRSDGSCTCGGGGRCRPGKHPRSRDWARGTDPAKIPTRSNLGVVLEGLLVVDLDGPASESVLGRLVAEHGPMPEGYAEARSGRPEGGRHLYFRLPPGMVAAAIPGVEILAGPGHYAVAPPSMHVSGRGYAWVRPLGRVEDLPWAPAWMLAPVEPEVEAEAEPWAGDGAAMLARAVGAVAMSSPGGHRRNITLHRWAYTLGGAHAGGGGPDLVVVRDALVDAARRCGLVAEDGLRQCRASIHSGWSAGVQRPLLAPVTTGDPADMGVLARVRVAMESRVWAGSPGAIQYRVLDLLLDLGEDHGRTEVRHSHRQVAEGTGVPRRTVGDALRALTVGGWLEVVARGAGRAGTTWRLRTPPDPGEDIPRPVGPRGGTGEGAETDPAATVPSAHDAWTVLPAQAPLVMGYVTSGPVRTTTLAEGLGVCPRQARRVLHALAQVGLVASDQGVWRLTDSAAADMGTALDTAAATLGCTGAMAQMCARHRQERTVYRSWWDGRERVRSRCRRTRPTWSRPRSELVPESVSTSLIGARGPP